MSEQNSNQWIDQVLDIIKNDEKLPEISDESDFVEDDALSTELGNF